MLCGENVINSLTRQSNLQVTELTSPARGAHWCKGEITIMGQSLCSLFECEACSMGRNSSLELKS